MQFWSLEEETEGIAAQVHSEKLTTFARVGSLTRKLLSDPANPDPQLLVWIKLKSRMRGYFDIEPTSTIVHELTHVLQWVEKRMTVSLQARFEVYLLGMMSTEAEAFASKVEHIIAVGDTGVYGTLSEISTRYVKLYLLAEFEARRQALEENPEIPEVQLYHKGRNAAYEAFREMFWKGSDNVIKDYQHSFTNLWKAVHEP